MGAMMAAGRPLRGATLSIAAQAVGSAANFITGVLLARVLLPPEFGVHALLFNGLLIMAGFQAALISGPLRVLGIGREEPDYLPAQRWIQLSLGLTIALLMLALLLFFDMPAALATAYGVGLVLFLMYELARTELFNVLDMRTLLEMDVTAYGLRLAGLVILNLSSELTLTTAWLVIGGAYLAALIIFLPGKSYPGTCTPAGLRAVVRENWNYGRWLMLEALAFTLSSSLYLYFTAIWLGKEAAAGLGAVLVLMNVFNFVMMGMVNHSTAIARHQLVAGRYAGWRRHMLRSGVLLAAASVLAVGLVSMFATPLLRSLYGSFYAGYAALVPVLGAAVCLRGVNSMLSVAFRTAGQPQVGFAAKLTSAAVTLLVAYPLLDRLGVMGAAWGMLLTQVLWTLVYAFYLMRGALGRERVAATAGRHTAAGEV